MKKTIITVLKALALGASVGAVVLLIMDVLSVEDAFMLLSIGTVALALSANMTTD